jgi:hypothetical protein
MRPIAEGVPPLALRQCLHGRTEGVKTRCRRHLSAERESCADNDLPTPDAIYHAASVSRDANSSPTAAANSLVES